MLSLFAVKDANAQSGCIGSAKSSYIKGAYASNIYAKVTCAKNAFSAIGPCIKDAGYDGTGTVDASRKNTYIKGTCAVKHLRIYLQSFSISKIKLFDTG